MRNGFVKVAALTPECRVADPGYNKEKIIELIDIACDADVQVMVFPELCITGAACGDFYYQDRLLEEARDVLVEIAAYTEKYDAILFLGLPVEYNGKLYDVAAVMSRGSILGLVPKVNVTGDTAAKNGRYFAPGMAEPVPVRIDDDHIAPMGTNLLFRCHQLPELIIGAEIGADLKLPVSPDVEHALAGATLMVNLAAEESLVGKTSTLRNHIMDLSRRLNCGYVYCDAGEGNSTQNMISAGQSLILENGEILEEATPFENESIISEIDIHRMNAERRRNVAFGTSKVVYVTMEFNLGEAITELSRSFRKEPFIPASSEKLTSRCNQIVHILETGLQKKLESAKANSVVICMDETLSSVLAGSVMVSTFDRMKLSRRGIYIVVPECKTQHLITGLFQMMGTVCVSGDVMEAEKIARETGAVMVCGANMTELSMGNYNKLAVRLADYLLNRSVPETLVMPLMDVYLFKAGNRMEGKLYNNLLANLELEQTPAEQLPGIVDFCLHYMLRCGFSPRKIYRLICQAYGEWANIADVDGLMKGFYERYFKELPNRGTLPEGPQIGTVTLTAGPVAEAGVWMAELEHLHEDEEELKKQRMEKARVPKDNRMKEKAKNAMVEEFNRDFDNLFKDFF